MRRLCVTYRDSPYEPERGYPVYAASKTLSEQEAWKFVREKKPGFVLNAVLPNINFGATLDSAGQGHPSTSGMVAQLFKGNPEPLAGLPARMFLYFPLILNLNQLFTSSSMPVPAERMNLTEFCRILH
jgi:hypothetical protein